VTNYEPINLIQNLTTFYQYASELYFSSSVHHIGRDPDSPEISEIVVKF